ncbi:penicillin-binding protein 2 [bacterium]|jgi:penicillin-binding protein 2|nr:penicillin-binding protein 2 [bacterium]MBT4648707.1 penicillin-binding protein 2 [bacterium]
MKDDPFKIQEGSVKDSRLKGFSKSRHSGDYVDFAWAKSAQTIGKFFADEKVNRLFFILLILLGILWGRGFYLQITKGESFRSVAEGNRLREELIVSNRGLIYDRFGNLLVKNVSHFFLYLSPRNLPEEINDREKLFVKLEELLDINIEEIKEEINNNSKRDNVLIYENIPYEEAMQLILLSETNQELSVSYEPRRQYFDYLGLAHVIGYLGDVTEDDLGQDEYTHNDRIGKTGLELKYENILRGQDGLRQIEVDALNREKNIIAWKEPIDGNDLFLTLDAKAQSKLHEIMTDNARKYDKPKMAAVVLDANDGGVLAMMSLPVYDNNIFTSSLNREDYNKIITDPTTPLLNRTINGTYPYGSVFKPIVAAAALEEEIINSSFTVNSTGGVQIGNSFFPDWRASGHGKTNIKWALADSVNTFFYTIGGGNNQWLEEGLGINKIIKYAKKFGLGQITGIDLISEADGFLPSKNWKEKTLDERWYLGDTYNLSIGQGYLLGTPIQTAVFMSYFATGQAYQPHFIKSTKSAIENQGYKSKLVLENLLDNDNLNIIRAGLRETVKTGTATSLQSVAVDVAGKTGTAQFNRNKTPHSWFTGFAPYDDPQIVITVLVEEGGDRGLAVTVARQFMEWYFER